jgi:hypothetical protein
VSTYDRALELVEELGAVDATVTATADPRAATPPCLLVVPPRVTWDGYCAGTALWSVYALAPGPANLDAWRALDDLLVIVAKVCPVESHQFVAYSLAPDAPLLPAYQVQFTQSVEVP